MFQEPRQTSMFDWGMLGDITEGRPNLGQTTDVVVYRLMQFTLRDVITQKKDFPAFVKELQDLLHTLKIGILRIEKADLGTLEFTMTVAEDLDCSGLPVCEETICTYDEGFIGGLLAEFTGRAFEVKEVDCWCSGDRVCRFAARPA